MAHDGLTRAAPTVREIKYQRRYGEMLDAAAAVFAEKGYWGASTKEIADRLGIRQGSLYYYFSSKEVALAEVCWIGVDGFYKGLSDIVGGTAPPLEKLRAAVANHLTPITTRRNYVKVFLYERHCLTGEAHAEVEGRVSEYEALFERLLDQGIEAGAIRADLDRRLAVLATLGMCNAVVEWFNPDRGPIERIAAQYADIVIRGLTAPD